MEIKKNIPNNTVTRKLVDLDKETGNIYESINNQCRQTYMYLSDFKACCTFCGPKGCFITIYSSVKLFKLFRFSFVPNAVFDVRCCFAEHFIQRY